MLVRFVALRWLRTRRAAWLALAAITLTVAVPVVVLGVVHGFLEVTRRQARANEADLTITPRFVSSGMADSAGRRDELAALPGIAGAAPFISTYAVLADVARSEDLRFNSAAVVEGIDWAADERLGRIGPAVLHPAPVENLSSPPLTPEQRGTGFLTPRWRGHLAFAGFELAGALGAPMPLAVRERPRPGAVLGREVLYGNGTAVGEAVQLVVPDASGGSTGRIAVEVSDTIGTGVLEIDKLLCLVPLPQAQRLTGMAAKDGKPARVSGYRLQAADPATDLNRLARNVADAVPAGNVRTWEQRRGNLVKSLEIQRNIMAVVMVAIQCITVFIVYAVFSTLVAEKRHDLGVLRALGATRRQVMGILLLAGAATCIAGCAAGWALGWGALAALNPLSKLLGMPLFPQDVIYTPDAPTSFDPMIPLFFCAVMTAIGILAVALPAWRAGRVDPVLILREGA